MNTHDEIELPPLPEWTDWPSTVADMSVSEIKESMQDYARSAIEPYKDEVARLQRIIDSRPAINAGLPQTYIEWSHSIYQMEAARVLEVKQ